ncbi:MAG: histidine kinase N-terminal 7TM domain-containing protein [Bacillota bacterium]
MDFYFDIKIFLQSISVILSLIMILYFLSKGKKTALLYSYIVCQIIIFIWSTGQMLLLFSQDLKTMWYSIVYEYIAVTFVSFSWLMFCLLYTYNRILAKRKLILLLLIPPLLAYISLVTNNHHYLFYSTFSYESITHGPLFWAHAVVSYVYLITGTVILIKHSMAHMGYARKQTILLIFAAFIPFVANILELANIFFSLNFLKLKFDLTPVSFAFSLLLFGFAAFKYKFLNIVPIAFRKIVHNLNESIIVVDSLNKIDSFNKSFTSTFPGSEQIKIYDNISKFIKSLKENIINSPETDKLIHSIKYETISNVSGELTLTRPVRKCFHVNIQPIFGSKNEFLGRIILFNDITEYKNLLDEVNEKNAELSALNDQLSEYASTVEELAVTKERNRFARDVHDTLGHTMTLLISLLEVSSIMCKKDPVVTEEKLSEALKAARDGLRELRRSIKGLAPEKFEATDIISSIKKLVEDFKPSGMEINFSYDRMDHYNVSHCADVIFRVCQEAITNSLRHGKAKHVDIILRLVNDRIKLFIFDDGQGCADIKKGFGLTGMQQRVTDLGGNIVFGSDGESGFNIRLELPLNKTKLD